MAATALFDSSALILYFNDALSIESIAVIRQGIENAIGAISVVTRAEVLAWPSHTEQSVDAAILSLASFEHLGVDTSVADEAARIRRECNLKLPDALIAASAVLLNLPVVTPNIRDFERVPQLGVIRL